VAGEGHRFRAVQLPVNLAMAEAATLPNQGGRTLLEAAAAHGMLVCSSASILQGRLARQTADVLVKAWPDLRSKAQVSLQFARSAPGLTTALVGMSRPEHVQENMELARRGPDEALVRKLLAPPAEG
jgi:predicted aldo/keto reductase-like oxidoreductase